MAQALIELVRGKFPDTAGSSHRGDEVVTVKSTRMKGVERFGGEVSEFRGETTVRLPREKILEACRYMKTECGFDMLTDLSGVDNFGEDQRFEVAYHLYSFATHERLRLKIGVPEDDLIVDSVVSVWRTADWHEREAFDMFGIRFRGHPNLKRLMLYPEFVGHPLRKDYPVRKRQLLVPELDFPDLIRGPGPGPGGAGVPMSQTHVGRANVDPNTYD